MIFLREVFRKTDLELRAWSSARIRITLLTKSSF
jgi:hypothetical protein